MTQQTFTCLQLTIDTLEKGFKCLLRLTIKMNTPERRHCRRSVVIIVNVELISHLLLMFLLLTLNSKCLLGIFNLSKKK